MQIDELVRLLAWTETDLRKRGIEQAYQTFVDVLSGNLRPNAPRQPFESQQQSLQSLLRAVDFTTLNDTQVNFADQMGFAGVIGAAGADAIDGITMKNAVDIATVHGKIVKMQQQYNTAMQKAGTMYAALHDLFPQTDADYDEAMVHIRFQGTAGITNVTELRNWADNWYLIAQGLARATDSAPEALKVVGAARGSFILDVATTYKIVDILSRILVGLAATGKGYYHLRKLAADVRKTELENEALEIANERAAQNASDLLEQRAQQALLSAQEKVLKSIQRELRLNAEQSVFLKRTIELLHDFKDGGGEIDTVVKTLPADSQSDTETQKRAEMVTTIRKNNADARKLNAEVLLLKQEIEPRAE